MKHARHIALLRQVIEDENGNKPMPINAIYNRLRQLGLRFKDPYWIVRIARDELVPVVNDRKHGFYIGKTDKDKAEVVERKARLTANHIVESEGVDVAHENAKMAADSYLKMKMAIKSEKKRIRRSWVPDVLVLLFMFVCVVWVIVKEMM